ncbi:hypothetical protein VT84_05100 [Gemmata sp. SH-PL17]|uniref:hypothetical protein n=1 Tax=Gemmata sp. SH-PL17 TaxID=1630693 RepID=UPI00078B7EB6|nr:hypothetical protein [Gemmata sp. SH-PL17]AMV23767.1 hypothetical protein VT84_05100 [Gemmata sp. SH-PL17]
MTAPEVLAVCSLRGVVLWPGGNGALEFWCRTGAMHADLKQLLTEHKPELLRLIAPCPECRRSLDRGRCWHCKFRRCETCRARDTGSPFIANCLQCQRLSDSSPGATP